MTLKQQGQAAGLFGAVTLFSALFCWLFIAGRFSHPAVWIQLVLAVGAIAIYLMTNLDSVGTKLTGRGTFYGAISAATAAIVILALGGLNYIAVKKPKTWDLTKEKIYTLSDQTVVLLRGLKNEVRVIAFYAPNEPEFGELEQRLRQYRQRTDKLKGEMLDPTKHVKEVKEFNISQGGPRVIVKAGGKESRAKDVDGANPVSLGRLVTGLPFREAPQHRFEIVLGAQAGAHRGDVGAFRPPSPGHATLDLLAGKGFGPDDQPQPSFR